MILILIHVNDGNAFNTQNISLFLKLTVLLLWPLFKFEICPFCNGINSKDYSKLAKLFDTLSFCKLLFFMWRLGFVSCYLILGDLISALFCYHFHDDVYEIWRVILLLLLFFLLCIPLHSYDESSRRWLFIDFFYIFWLFVNICDRPRFGFRGSFLVHLNSNSFYTILLCNFGTKISFNDLIISKFEFIRFVNEFEFLQYH